MAFLMSGKKMGVVEFSNQKARSLVWSPSLLVGVGGIVA